MGPGQDLQRPTPINGAGLQALEVAIQILLEQLAPLTLSLRQILEII